MKKLLALLLAGAMAISMVACSSAPAGGEGETETGSVYYLNFKP